MIASRIFRFWQSHPFVRLLLPFVLGVMVVDGLDGFGQSISAYLLWALILWWSTLLLTGFIQSWHKRIWYGMAASLFFFLFGAYVCAVHWKQVTIDWPDEVCLYKGHLTEGATPKKRSILCPVRVTGLQIGDTCRSIDSHILLYLPQEGSATTLKAGDTIYFYGQVKKPENFTPTFDYVRYLHHRHVSGTLYTREWKKCDSITYGWKAQALHHRDKLLDYYQRAGVKGDELAVLSALTLGYKEDLSEDIVQQYSISGASHVLALSGLHIGILCMIITSFFAIFLRGRNKTRWCRLLSLPLIGGFVALVGFPVSAIRAAVMFSFLVIGSCLTRVGFSLNTLALTAFCMLVYNPFYLFDVGFQMSFAAVASLLLLQPWMEGLIPRPQNAILRYLWGITTVSLSAQVGVVPLIIYYFSRISTYALVVNLWVVPLTFLIVSLSIPFLLLSLLPLPHIQSAMGWLVGLLTRCMNHGLTLCNKLPGADISGIDLSVGEAACLYVTLFFFFYGLIHQRRRAIIGILGCLCVGVFIRIFT